MMPNSEKNRTRRALEARFAPLARSHLGAHTRLLLDGDRLLAALGEAVLEPFHHLTGLTAVIMPIDVPAAGADSPRLIPHPICRDVAGSPVCRESRLAHMTELGRRPGSGETHWHRCGFGRLCAMVPVAWKGRCRAACQLVCGGGMEEGEFERRAELLEVLVENFVGKTEDCLPRATLPDAPPGSGAATTGGVEGELRIEQIGHPTVRRAVMLIHRNLTDPDLAVGSIARQLEMNASYLAHLFSVEVGMRMSGYIARRRIHLAKQLLENTDWPVKRISQESGHECADWFSHQFRLHTGQTPGEYRRAAAGRLASQFQADTRKREAGNKWAIGPVSTSAGSGNEQI